MPEHEFFLPTIPEDPKPAHEQLQEDEMGRRTGERPDFAETVSEKDREERHNWSSSVKCVGKGSEWVGGKEQQERRGKSEGHVWRQTDSKTEGDKTTKTRLGEVIDGLKILKQCRRLKP